MSDHGPVLPTFIGIGAPKAGTTWLFRCLQQHPGVFMAPAKETNFFDYGSIEGRMAEYMAHFRGHEGQRAVGELSTRYLASAPAPLRIRRVLPDVRLFVSLRNPVDQVYSHYWHLRRQNFHQWRVRRRPESFEEALETYPDRLLGPARYGEHLERWLAHFDRDRLLVVTYDQIDTDPGAVLEALYGFVGVDAGFRPPAYRERGAAARAGVAPRGAFAEGLHARLHSFLSRRLYLPLKRAIGVSRGDRLKEALRVRQVLERVFFTEGYPPMAAGTRDRLIELFRADVDRTSELVGRDLRHWLGA